MLLLGYLSSSFQVIIMTLLYWGHTQHSHLTYVPNLRDDMNFGQFDWHSFSATSQNKIINTISSESITRGSKKGNFKINTINRKLGGGFRYLLFSPLLG